MITCACAIDAACFELVTTAAAAGWQDVASQFDQGRLTRLGEAKQKALAEAHAGTGSGDASAIDAGEALDQPQVLAGASELLLFVEVGRLDNQGVPLPAASRVTHPLTDGWSDMRPAVKRDDASFTHHLVENRHVLRSLQDLEILPRRTISHRGHTWLPSYNWIDGGWVARVWAIPRSPELRGREDIRPLGILPAETEERPVWLALRAKLETKAVAYGDLEAPYVIAINAPDALRNEPRSALAGAVCLGIRKAGGVGARAKPNIQTAPAPASPS